MWDYICQKCGFYGEMQEIINLFAVFPVGCQGKQYFALKTINFL